MNAYRIAGIIMWSAVGYVFYRAAMLDERERRHRR